MMTTNVRTNRRIVLAARPQGAATSGLLSPGRGADRRASRGRSLASHPVAVARPLHARTHERPALLCPAGRDRRRHDGANRRARREFAPSEFSRRRSGALRERLAGVRKCRMAGTWSSCLPACSRPRRRSASWECRASRRTSGCSISASRKRETRWWLQRPPVPSARWSDRSPNSKAAGSSGSPAVPRSAPGRSEQLGFDACVDHRAAALGERLTDACPGGIDIYFENVGGNVFRAVLPLINAHAPHSRLRTDLPVQRGAASRRTAMGLRR